MPEVVKRLEKGIRVADIGCGSGAAALAMARAYPASRVVGYDIDPRAIERSRVQGEASGLDNVSFEVLTGEEIPGGFDLITTFDVIHDLADPEAVLARIRDALNPGATYLMMEPNVGASLADNVHAQGTLLYGISVLFCLPQSLVSGGPGLGTAWGPVRAEQLCRKAGFTYFRRLEIDNPFSAFYEIRA
jgi:2-polyprenyl-3-methyl-5-hydroxy-6-metoxy-1,4-benzoquinol methylase